jgi:hypothetical protein
LILQPGDGSDDLPSFYKHPVLYLSPLIKAKARIDRLTDISRHITQAAKRHPWLSPALLAPHLLVRWLNRREIDRLQHIGYPLTRSKRRTPGH